MDPLPRALTGSRVVATRRCSHAPRQCIIIAGPLRIAFVKFPEQEFLPAERIVTE